jgi:CheY-like chemotaxis protein
MDINMPVMDGIESTIKILKEIKQHDDRCKSQKKVPKLPGMIDLGSNNSNSMNSSSSISVNYIPKTNIVAVTACTSEDTKQ